MIFVNKQLSGKKTIRINSKDEIYPHLYHNNIPIRDAYFEWDKDNNLCVEIDTDNNDKLCKAVNKYLLDEQSKQMKNLEQAQTRLDAINEMLKIKQEKALSIGDKVIVHDIIDDDKVYAISSIDGITTHINDGTSYEVGASRWLRINKIMLYSEKALNELQSQGYREIGIYHFC